MAPFARNGTGANAYPELAISFRKCYTAASLDESFGESPPRTALPKLRSPTKLSSYSPLSTVSTSMSSTPAPSRDAFYESSASFYSKSSSGISVEDDIVFDSQQGRPLISALMSRTGPRPRTVLQTRSLPLLPPVFSSSLSPTTQDGQLQSMLRSASSQTAHETPATASGLQSPLHPHAPNRLFASRPAWTGRGPEPDPCLRVVSLSHWLQELGLISGIPDGSVPGARIDATDASPQGHLLVTGRSWQGSGAGSDNRTRQSKLDRTFVKHLATLIESGPLSLSEVVDDLQIWRLKLHDRTARRRLADLFGKTLLKSRDYGHDFTLQRNSVEDKPAAAESPGRHKGYTSADLFGASEETEIGRASGNSISKPKPSASSVRTYQATAPVASTAAEPATKSIAEERHVVDQSVPVPQAVILDEISEDEFKKRRKKNVEDEEARKEGPGRSEDDQRNGLKASEGSPSQEAERDGRGWDRSAPDLDFGSKDRDRLLEVEVEEPPPTGLFRIKSPSLRSTADDRIGKRLFPRVRATVDDLLHIHDEEESLHEKEDSWAQVLHPPTREGAKMRSDLQKQWREAIRIAFERALREVEIEFEFGVSR